MRKHSQLVRIKKLKGAGSTIEVAAKHNLREIAAEIGCYGTIDGKRSAQNYILKGGSTSTEVVEMAKSLMDHANITRLRKDAVRALELIISLHRNSSVNSKAFFSDSLAWAEGYFQGAPIVSAVVHLDQTSPHCHILILPLVEGRMNGSRLMGNKAKLQSMQADYHENVGKRYGLTYQGAGSQPGASILSAEGLDILNAIRANPELLHEPQLAEALIVAFTYNTDAILLALDSQSATAMPICFDTSRLVSSQNTKPISFPPIINAENMRSLSCVGFDV